MIPPHDRRRAKHAEEASAETAPVLRVKVGLNPYANRHTCAYCREEFERGGLWIRLELAGTIVDMPLCGSCLDAGQLYETVVPFDEHHRSFPPKLA